MESSSVLLLVLAAGVIAGCDRPRGEPLAPPRAPTMSDAAVSVPRAFERVPRSALRVTSGEIGVLPSGLMSIDAPSVRAVAEDFMAPVAGIRFRYRGPTAETRRLASGRVKRQIGLKLKAADGCNVIYVMWQLEPELEIAVLSKINPGQHTHGECGARGYSRPRPRRSSAAPAPGTGVWHTLHARIEGGALIVHADGAVVWEGSLGPAELSLRGPIGLRTDNGRFDLNLYASSDSANEDSDHDERGSQ